MIKNITRATTKQRAQRAIYQQVQLATCCRACGELCLYALWQHVAVAWRRLVVTKSADACRQCFAKIARRDTHRGTRTPYGCADTQSRPKPNFLLREVDEVCCTAASASPRLLVLFRDHKRASSFGLTIDAFYRFLRQALPLAKEAAIHLNASNEISAVGDGVTITGTPGDLLNYSGLELDLGLDLDLNLDMDLATTPSSSTLAPAVTVRAPGNRSVVRVSADVPIWVVPCYSAILLCAVVGNLLVVLTLVQNRRMRTITNVFLLNLAISDILLGVFCMPVTLVGTLLRHFIFGELLCKLIQFAQGEWWKPVGQFIYVLSVSKLKGYPKLPTVNSAIISPYPRDRAPESLVKWPRTSMTSSGFASRSCWPTSRS